MSYRKKIELLSQKRLYKVDFFRNSSIMEVENSGNKK